MIHLFRTRFARDIVAEVLPPRLWKSRRPSSRKPPSRRSSKKSLTKVIILCDGMPTVPSKRALMAFLAKKGYWVFHPRYRGSWESGGKFLRKSPECDILDVIDQLPHGFIDLLSGKKYRLRPTKLYLLGGSFGGPAVILASRHPRVTKGIALCPVVDWNQLGKSDRLDTKPYFLKEAFGSAYRFTLKDWNKLKSGRFYSSIATQKTINGKKLLIIQTKDDKSVRWQPVAKFAAAVDANLWLMKTGGHLSTSLTMKPRFYKRIHGFMMLK